MASHRLKNPNLGVLINSHEIDKIAGHMERVAREEGETEIEKLAKHLQEVIADMYAVVWTNGKSDEKSVEIRKRMLEKYKHNIPHVIEKIEDEKEHK